MCPLSEDMGCRVGFGRCHSTCVQSCRMVSGGTGGSSYFDNQLELCGHLMYSLNFHQAKQGPPHQRTLSDQLQLHATCRPNLRAKINKKRNKRTWRPDYLYQPCSPQVFINAEVFDRRKLSTEAKGKGCTYTPQ